MKKNTLNKEIDNFAIVSFQMLKLPQPLHALHVLHVICTILFY